jgi:hypothetical protein
MIFKELSEHILSAMSESLWLVVESLACLVCSHGWTTFIVSSKKSLTLA